MLTSILATPPTGIGPISAYSLPTTRQTVSPPIWPISILLSPPILNLPVSPFLLPPEPPPQHLHPPPTPPLKHRRHRRQQIPQRNQPTLQSQPTPPPTPTNCPVLQGTLNEAELWRSEYIEGNTGTTERDDWQADFVGATDGSCDGFVDIDDFEAWREKYISNLH